MSRKTAKKIKSHKKTRKSRGGSWWNPFSTNVAVPPVEQQPKKWWSFFGNNSTTPAPASAPASAPAPAPVVEQPNSSIFSSTPPTPSKSSKAGKKSKK
jgi:hypothetical protein